MLEKVTNLDVLSVNIKMIGDEETEAWGVQVSAGTDDTVWRETGEFPCHVSEHVHGIGNDKENGVGGVTNQRGYDFVKEGDVPL